MIRRGLLILLAACSSAWAQTAPPLSAAQYSRDQPTVREIQRWNGRIVLHIAHRGWTQIVRSDGKPIAATTTLLTPEVSLREVTLPTEEHFVDMLDLAEEPRQSWALAKTHFGLALWRRPHDGYWQAVTLPDMIRTSSQRLSVIPTGKALPVLAGDGALYFDSVARQQQGLADTWDLVRFPPEPRHITMSNMGPHARHMIYDGDVLYLGYDAKWREGAGAGLYRYDFARQQWANMQPWDRQMAVVSLARSPAGDIWATMGELQGTNRRGEIRNLSQDKLHTAIDSMSMTRTENWDLEPAAPMDMTFDNLGRMVVLSGEFGPVRHTGRSGFGEARWERLIPAQLWDQHVFVTALYILSERYILMGTVDMGLLVWDSRASALWRLRSQVLAQPLQEQ